MRFTDVLQHSVVFTGVLGAIRALVGEEVEVVTKYVALNFVNAAMCITTLLAFEYSVGENMLLHVDCAFLDVDCALLHADCPNFVSAGVVIIDRRFVDSQNL